MQSMTWTRFEQLTSGVFDFDFGFGSHEWSCSQVVNIEMQLMWNLILNNPALTRRTIHILSLAAVHPSAAPVRRKQPSLTLLMRYGAR